MRGNVRWTHVTIALAVIAALAIAAPAIGGPSLKKLVKKEVAKQIGTATGPPGPAGPAGPPGANGADGADGVDGVDGVNGVDGTARAYALVVPHGVTPCTGGAGGDECTIARSKGVTGVTRAFTGDYCVTAPGIDASEVPAAVTVDWSFTGDPQGNASAMIRAATCGAGVFEVITERQPQTTVRDAAGTGTTSVAGNADLADNVGFTIVIP